MPRVLDYAGQNEAANSSTQPADAKSVDYSEALLPLGKRANDARPSANSPTTETQLVFVAAATFVTSPRRKQLSLFIELGLDFAFVRCFKRLIDFVAQDAAAAKNWLTNAGDKKQLPSDQDRNESTQLRQLPSREIQMSSASGRSMHLTCVRDDSQELCNKGTPQSLQSRV